MKEGLLQWLKNQVPEWSSKKYLIAVSGGRDSICLAHLFQEMNLNIELAHVNFGLRKEESDEDEVFVTQWAKQRQIPIHIQSFDTKGFAQERGISTQMAARELRYSWFYSLLEQHELDYLVVGTHQGDEAETILLNQFRGTGLHGLHGIASVRHKTLRPLLALSRQEINQYVEKNKISYREDSSNQSTDYQRNAIRLKVIPEIKKIYPQAEKTLTENAQRIRQAEAIYQQEIERQRQNLVENEEAQTRIEIQGLRRLPAQALYLYEFISDMGFNHDDCQAIAETLHGQSGKQFFSPTHRLVRDREYLLVEPKSESRVEEVSISDLDTKIDQPIYLSISRETSTPDPIPTSTRQAWLDLDQLKFPLTLRKWQPGDTFQPLGMKGQKKKISDFLTDLKLSLPEKENTFVLLSGGNVVWVVGHRISHRYRLTKATKTIYLVEWHER
ncbi:tRNA lysidine(34) synthetase TilS [bacterium SCSIO 12741]|nr:tRNA lysidine(34) synthetase TilS [bacterium SCSIO 12741]